MEFLEQKFGSRADLAGVIIHTFCLSSVLSKREKEFKLERLANFISPQNFLFLLSGKGNALYFFLRGGTLSRRVINFSSLHNWRKVFRALVVKALMCFDFFVGPSLLADTKSSIRHTRRFPANEMKKGGKVNLHIRLAFAHAKRAAKNRTVANLGIGALCSQKHRLAETEDKHFFVSLENFIHGGVFSRHLVSNLHSERGWRGRIDRWRLPSQENY